MRVTPLPPHLGTTFGVGAAAAEGVSPRRLRYRDLERPTRGTRRIRNAATGEDALVALALAAAPHLAPHAFFGAVTAAVLWGIPLPPTAVDPDILDVCVVAPHRNPRGKGIRGHECAPHLVRAMDHPVFGVRLASPASTWASLATHLPDAYDLVAAGDAVIRMPQHTDDPPQLATLAQLTAVVDAGRRVGVGRLRVALPRIRPGSSSRPESHARLVLVDGGLPEPVLAHEVRDPDGTLVARVDLAYPEMKIAIEYEGEHHFRDPEQWRADVERYERLAERGWRVIRVTKDMLFDAPATLVARVRAARAGR